MHAFLIVNSSPEHRKKEIENILSLKNIGETPLNRYVLEPRQLVEKSTYSIDDIRTLTSWTSQLHSQPSAVMIEQAERLSEPAQHALLKTLEEGASNVSILLTADSEQSLLPTIQSRCQIIRVVHRGESIPEEESQRIVNWILKCSKKNPAIQILSLYQALSKIAGKTVSPHFGSIQRQDGLQFLDKTIHALHANLKGQTLSTGSDLSTKRQAAMMLKLAIAAHHQLRQNGNACLVLQQFMIDISE